MVADVCIAPNLNKFECLEFCPDGTCIKEYAKSLSLAVLASVLTMISVFL